MEGTFKFFGFTAVLLISLIELGVEGGPGLVNIQINVLQYNNTDGMSYRRSNFTGPRKCCDVPGKINCRTKINTCDTYFLYGFGRITRNRFIGSLTNTTDHILSDKNYYSYSEERNIIAYTSFDNWTQSTIMLINVWDKDRGGKDLIDNMTSLVGGLATGWNQSAAPKHILSLQNHVSLALEIQIWCKDGYFGTSCDKVCTSDFFHICNRDGKKEVSPSCMRKDVLVLRGQVKNRDQTTLQNELENMILHIMCSSYTPTVTVHILEINKNSYVAFTAQCNGTNVDVLKFQMVYIVNMLVPKLSMNFKALVPSMLIKQSFYQDKTKSQPFRKGNNFLMLLSMNELTRKPDPGCATSTCTYYISICVFRDCSGSDRWLDFNVAHRNGSIINCKGHLSDPTLFNSHTGQAATFFLKLDVMPAFIRVKVKGSINQGKVWNFNQTLNSSYLPGLQYNMADTQTVTLLNADSLSVTLELVIWCATYSSTSFLRECRSSSHICLPGYTGTDCKSDIDECQALNPCQHNGVCINTPGMFKCNCTRGWTGPTCVKDVDECLLEPCQNGNNCTNSPGSYDCGCPDGFKGVNCQDIDECMSDPCRNGATCLNTLGTYTCRCRNGFTGTVCETDVNECKERVCSKSSLNCTNSFGSFACNCKNGWEGQFCQNDTDECENTPCKNNGSCKNLPGTYTCNCSSGWNGTHCEQDINECNTDRTLCRNGGTCINTIGDFNCSCNKAWTGKTCSVDVDECHLKPCYNGGTCTNFDGGYNCTCTSGWRGMKCHDDKDECLSSPCHNNGLCSNTQGGYNCTCKQGWAGKKCENDVDECTKLPCLNAATCQNSIGSYSCSCLPGWSGHTCAIDINECKSNPCRNAAICLNTLGAFTCQCRDGFTGMTCETDKNECKEKICGEHSLNCKNTFGSFTCNCKNGWEGRFCQNDTDECAHTPCKHNGSCKNLPGAYKCNCSSGWNGTHCEQDINECNTDRTLCKNGGTCQNTIGSYSCSCLSGWSGPVCTLDIDECKHALCLNGGQCENIPGTYSCNCLSGWNGQNCSRDVDECFSSPCHNKGRRENFDGSFKCSCPNGWTGSFCQTDVNECEGNVCKNNATCINLKGSYSCTCSSGWNGNACDSDINECIQNPCKNEATCQNTYGSFICECFSGWKGSYCETDINECLFLPCLNGGTCSNFDGNYNCTCTQRWEGKNCTQDFDECKTNPCFHDALCTNTNGGFTCNCPDEWSGEKCSIDVNECLSSPCVNNGSCINEHGGYRCLCSSAWTGSKCELDQDECLVKPCKHGICENTNGSYNCKCPVQWMGIDCSKDVNECELDPCEYNSTCLNIPGSYTCTCTAGWTGANCSFDLDECSSNPCKNRGICSNLEGSFACTCRSGWTGINCQTRIPTTSTIRTINTVLSSTNQTSTRSLYNFKSTKMSHTMRHDITEYSSKDSMPVHNSTYPENVSISNTTKKQQITTDSGKVTHLVNNNVKNIATAPDEIVTSGISTKAMNISIVQPLVSKTTSAQANTDLSKDTRHLSKVTGVSNGTNRRMSLHTTEMSTQTIQHSTPANKFTQNIQNLSTAQPTTTIPNLKSEGTMTMEQTLNIMTFATTNKQTKKDYGSSKTRTHTYQSKQPTNSLVQNSLEISSVTSQRVTNRQPNMDTTASTKKSNENNHEHQEGVSTLAGSRITPRVRTTYSKSTIHNTKRTTKTVTQSSTYDSNIYGITKSSTESRFQDNVLSTTPLHRVSIRSISTSTAYVTQDSTSGKSMATISSVTIPASTSIITSATDTVEQSDLSKLKSSNHLPLIAGAGGGGALVLIVVIIAVIRCRRNRRLNDGINSPIAAQGNGDTKNSILKVNPMYDVYESDKPTDHFC